MMRQALLKHLRDTAVESVAKLKRLLDDRLSRVRVVEIEAGEQSEHPSRRSLAHGETTRKSTTSSKTCGPIVSKSTPIRSDYEPLCSRYRHAHSVATRPFSRRDPRVTRNRQDFEMIEALPLEDWSA